MDSNTLVFLWFFLVVMGQSFTPPPSPLLKPIHVDISKGDMSYPPPIPLSEPNTLTLTKSIYSTYDTLSSRNSDSSHKTQLSTMSSSSSLIESLPNELLDAICRVCDYQGTKSLNSVLGNNRIIFRQIHFEECVAELYEDSWSFDWEGLRSPFANMLNSPCGHLLNPKSLIDWYLKHRHYQSLPLIADILNGEMRVFPQPSSNWTIVLMDLMMDLQEDRALKLVSKMISANVPFMNTMDVFAESENSTFMENEGFNRILNVAISFDLLKVMTFLISHKDSLDYVVLEHAVSCIERHPIKTSYSLEQIAPKVRDRIGWAILINRMIKANHLSAVKALVSVEFPANSLINLLSTAVTYDSSQCFTFLYKYFWESPVPHETLRMLLSSANSREMLLTLIGNIGYMQYPSGPMTDLLCLKAIQYESPEIYSPLIRGSQITWSEYSIVKELVLQSSKLCEHQAMKLLLEKMDELNFMLDRQVWLQALKRSCSKNCPVIVNILLSSIRNHTFGTHELELAARSAAWNGILSTSWELLISPQWQLPFVTKIEILLKHSISHYQYDYVYSLLDRLEYLPAPFYSERLMQASVETVFRIALENRDIDQILGLLEWDKHGYIYITPGKAWLALKTRNLDVIKMIKKRCRNQNFPFACMIMLESFSRVLINSQN